MTAPIILGVLLRAHERERSLRIALSEAFCYGTLPGIESYVCIGMDRPTDAVLDIVFDACRSHRCRASAFYFNRPILDSSGEHFLEAQNQHLSEYELRFPAADWLYMADDDRWFEPLKIDSELPAALADRSIDAYFCTSYFMWDRPDLHNTVREHRSALLWRHIPGQRFHGLRMLNVPDDLYDAAVVSGRTADIKTPLLDYGSFNGDLRLRNWQEFDEAGKHDAFTRSLSSPPIFRRFPPPGYGPWRDLWTESYHA